MTQSLKRRFLARCALPLALAALGFASGGAGAVGPAQTGLVYVGTQGNQIHALRFDASSGRLAPLGPVAEGLRPTWVLAHPRLPVLYAVDDDKARPGKAVAYAVDRASGALAAIGEAATGGEGTTYLSLDTPSATLLAASFGSGTASSIALKPDGSPGALVSAIKAIGSGPHKRQASAHAHAAVADPSGRYVLVPDFGADRLFVYGFDRATRALAPDDGPAPRSLALPPGSGPRHLVFGADGRFAYLLSELTAQITVLRWNAEEGRLAPVQTLATSSGGFGGVRSGAELGLGVDGRYLYVADRGEGALVVYRVDPSTGELSLLQRISSGGDKPWGFAIDPSGKWLVVANQGGGSVNLFGIDAASGMLADSGQSAAVPTPVSIAFVK
jgi:6-phosphogluconolactonase